MDPYMRKQCGHAVHVFRILDPCRLTVLYFQLHGRRTGNLPGHVNHDPAAEAGKADGRKRLCGHPVPGLRVGARCPVRMRKAFLDPSCDDDDIGLIGSA